MNMRSAYRLLPLLAALMSTSCEAPTASPPASAAPPPSASAAAPSTPAAVRAPSVDLTHMLARSNDAFAFELYAKVRGGQGNLALSPFSVFTALSMTFAGARGETAAQMAKALHLAAANDRILETAGGLAASYAAPDAKVTLRVANRLFGDKAFSFDPLYLSRVKTAFGAPLEPIDFAKGAEKARGRINDWVAKETEDRIKDLIPKGALDGDTRLVLTNAIYFLGDWARPFDHARTTAAPFSVPKSAPKAVPTMHAIETFRFAATDGVKLLELPYQGGALAMTIVLPNVPDGLDEVEARLTPDVLDRWTKSLAPGRVAVSLPTFTIDPAASLALGDALRALGMSAVFDRAQADLTGIANPPSPTDRLFLSRVFHKCFVRVDEKGTEAAAATAAVVVRAGAAPGSPAEFKADHPFLFLLRDTRSGMILFMGRVVDPSARA